MLRGRVSQNDASKPSVLIAWSVHGFTAGGAVLGTFALLAIASERLGSAVLLMLAALFIDGIDGTLARAARVSEYTPQLDGRRLDDIVDYLKTPLDREDLLRILGAVDEVPGDMVRRDPAFADSGVVETSLDDLDAVVDLLLAHPALMQRPVGLVGDRAVVARPSERILDLLDD